MRAPARRPACRPAHRGSACRSADPSGSPRGAPRLAGEPSLRRAEHEDTASSTRQGRADRDEDDVAAEIVEPGEQGDGIPPDPDDEHHVVAELERQVFTQQLLRVQGRSRVPPRLHRPRSGRPGRCRLRRHGRTPRLAATRLPVLVLSLAARTRPSGSRSSTRRISPLLSIVPMRPSSDACSCGDSPFGSRTLGSRPWWTKPRIVARSLARVEFRVDVDE